MTDIPPPALPPFDGSQPCASADPEAFFPERADGSVDYAKRACVGCEFRDPCYAYALHWNVEGIWGGSTYWERRKHRRRLGIAAQPLTPSIPPDRHNEIRRLAARGMPVVEIAARVEMTDRSVHRILQESA